MVNQEQTSLSWLDEEINSSVFSDRRHASRFKSRMQKLWRGMGNTETSGGLRRYPAGRFGYLASSAMVRGSGRIARVHSRYAGEAGRSSDIAPQCACSACY
ncbi:hypothetical protein F9N64_19585 [Salmonella enterica]|nr:hypothetical protein [Salmonella enterica subsp. salamae]EGU9002773.1 hypothetical protein [Salmonella enterica]